MKKKKPKIIALLDKYDQISAYVFLSAFVIWELFGMIKPEWIELLNLKSDGSFVLLALGILTLLHSINDSLSKTKMNIRILKISEGLIEMLTSKSTHSKIDMFLKDGIGFYITYSESDVHIKSMRVIIVSDIIIDGWKKLYYRGMIDKLIIKKYNSSENPLFHLTILPDEYVLFGDYGIIDGVSKCISSTLIENTGRETKEFMRIYSSIYEKLWEDSEMIFDSSNDVPNII